MTVSVRAVTFVFERCEQVSERVVSITSPIARSRSRAIVRGYTRSRADSPILPYRSAESTCDSVPDSASFDDCEHGDWPNTAAGPVSAIESADRRHRMAPTCNTARSTLSESTPVGTSSAQDRPTTWGAPRREHLLCGDRRLPRVHQGMLRNLAPAVEHEATTEEFADVLSTAGVDVEYRIEAGVHVNGW